LAVAVVYTRIHLNEASMPTVTSRTFRSGNSEAVRLPKDVAFGEEIDVTIVRSGDVLTIYPKRMSIADMLSRLEKLPRPASIEERDTEEIRERPGL
jgi:antitoxin VapB